jgi:hypothetical protein
VRDAFKGTLFAMFVLGTDDNTSSVAADSLSAESGSPFRILLTTKGEFRCLPVIGQPKRNRTGLKPSRTQAWLGKPTRMRSSRSVRTSTNWAAAVGTGLKTKEFTHPYKSGKFGAVAQGGRVKNVFYNA